MLLASSVFSPLPTMSYEEYLERGALSNMKLEFLGSVVYAMAGGNQIPQLPHWKNHHRPADPATMAQMLRPGFKKSCHHPLREAVFYPDISVICDAKLMSSAKPITDPLLVVEVLSPSTRKYDLSRKLEQYKLIPSLRHIVFIDAIVFIDSESIGAQIYTRREGEVWPGFPHTYTSREDSLVLGEWAISIPLAEIYEDLEF